MVLKSNAITEEQKSIVANFVAFQIKNEQIKEHDINRVLVCELYPIYYQKYRGKTVSWNATADALDLGYNTVVNIYKKYHYLMNFNLSNLPN